MMQEKLKEILKQVADSENIINYEIFPHIDVLKGDGFLSEGYTGEVVDKDRGSKIQTYIKMAPPQLPEITDKVYYNECHFYSKIFPELNKFQLEKGVKIPFRNIPKYYCGNDKGSDKFLVMEDLKLQNYKLVNKLKYLERDHLKFIFEAYGKFHALSFAFKDQNFEKYSELTKPLNNMFIIIAEGINRSFDIACNLVKETDMDIYKKLEPIQENPKEAFVKAATYDGKYSGLTHGDCWSNNMLFKYKENGQIENLKLLDFQLCCNSTPIHDLSYFFYSGASAEDLDKLDEYLELYHNSFSAFARELGSNPEKLLPLNELKLEWKKFSILGICMSILVWSIKLISKENAIKVADSTNREETFQELGESMLQSDTYKKICSDIFKHAVEYEII